MPNLAQAQQLLGHKNRSMTEHYTRERKGEAVAPVSRSFKEVKP